MTRLRRLMQVFVAMLLASTILVFVAINHSHLGLKNFIFRKGYYPNLYPCHYTKLRPRYYGDGDTEETNIVCRQRRSNISSCTKAVKYYGSPIEELVVPKCPSKTKPTICWFQSTFNPTLNCSIDVCHGHTLYIGRWDWKVGDVRRWVPIKPFQTDKVAKLVDTGVFEGETFCFMRCGSIVQVLVFPPVLFTKETNKSNTAPHININIILIDSISRPHFYRMMRNSTKALRGLMEEQQATVLDFEKVQSIGTGTFENVRALFSGQVDKDSEQKSLEIGLRVVYDYYKSHGYYTVFQEDLCWFDRWGTVLDNIEMKTSSKITKGRWVRFKETISKHAIDNYGITFFSCEVFKLYNDTNHFEYPQKVCLNGKFFSSYFLQYLQDLTETTKLSHNTPPYVSYTHLNTAHTAHGTRIRNMDEPLSLLVDSVGRDPSTWTIILSDHGHKTTPYTTTTIDGLYESTNPVLFMIIPQRMAQILGKDIMSTLARNQNRLITTLDLHHTLMSFLSGNKTGLFVEIPAGRICADVPLKPLAVCQCRVEEIKYEDNSQSLVWMAEFAVGHMNNQIQDQLLQGELSPTTSHCRRLIGRSFTNIVQTGSHTTFNIHIDATNVGLNEPEVFKVSILTTKDGAEFESFERLTLYNKFQHCVDKPMDIKLCICKIHNSKQSKQTRKHFNNEIKVKMFQVRKITSKILYKKCLFKVTRLHKGGYFAVELANVCRRRLLSVSVEGRVEQGFLSTVLPLYVEIQPFQTTFLFSGFTKSLQNIKLRFKVNEL